MVDFNSKHKEDRVGLAGNPGTSVIDWYSREGNPTQIDVSQLETSELWDLRASIEHFCQQQLAIIDAELNDWQTIYCSVCGEEDLAYRGHPFITWGIRGGYTLCPRHVRAYDRIGTPEAEIIKQARQEAREIQELFG